MRRNAFCCVRVVKRDDLTDMIAAAVTTSRVAGALSSGCICWR
jgi:hypothetical protein